jgi:hypothetical protein
VDQKVINKKFFFEFILITIIDNKFQTFNFAYVECCIGNINEGK